MVASRAGPIWTVRTFRSEFSLYVEGDVTFGHFANARALASGPYNHATTLTCDRYRYRGLA
jgi:hypothetical protein